MDSHDTAIETEHGMLCRPGQFAIWSLLHPLASYSKSSLYFLYLPFETPSITWVEEE